MKTPYLLGTALAALLSSVNIQAALILDVESITTNQITFSLSGNPDSGGLPLDGVGYGSFNDHVLRFFSTNQSDWIVSTGESYTDQSIISGNPMNTVSQIDLIQVHEEASAFVLGIGGLLTLIYDSDLLLTDSGTGISTTITLPQGWNFVPENLTSLSLSWGYLTTDDPITTGALQSSYSLSSVPLPATVWLFSSGLLGLIGISKRKK